MSNYTMTVRTICNSSFGAGWERANIDDVINAGRRKIFNFDYEFFDQDYKAVIETKVIRHYFMHEIGRETLNLWLFDFRTKWMEIIDYYNKFYVADLLKFDPLKNTDYNTSSTNTSNGNTVDYGTVHTDTTDTTNSGSTTVDTKNATSEIDQLVTTDGLTTDTGSVDHIKGSEQTTTYIDRETTTTYNSQDTESGSTNTIRYTAEQDTPQGKLQDIKNLTYLSKADYLDETVTPKDHKSSKSGNDKVTDSGSVRVSSTGTDTDEHKNDTKVDQDVRTQSEQIDNSSSKTEVDAESKSVGTVDTRTDSHSDTNSESNGNTHTGGKTGSETYSEMLQKYRNTFINIDMMIINDLREMFMLVW